MQGTHLHASSTSELVQRLMWFSSVLHQGPNLALPLLLTFDAILTLILFLVSAHEVQGHMTNRK